MTDDGGYTEDCALCGRAMPHDHGWSEWNDALREARNSVEALERVAPRCAAPSCRVITKHLCAEHEAEFSKFRKANFRDAHDKCGSYVEQYLWNEWLFVLNSKESP